MNDDGQKIKTYMIWCAGVIVVWLTVNYSALGTNYYVYWLTNVLSVLLVSPGIFCLLALQSDAESAQQFRRPSKIAHLYVALAVNLGELLDGIPRNPFATMLPYAHTLQARFFVLTDNNVAAEKVLRRFLAANATKFATERCKFVALTLLSVALTNEGRYEESKDLRNKAASVLESDKDVDPEVRAGYLGDWCAMLSQIGDTDQAIALGKQALTLMENAPFNNNDQLALLARVVNNLAVAYNYAGNTARARELYQRSLDLKLKLFGDNSREAVIAYANLGYADLLTGNIVKASHALEKAKALALSLHLGQTRLWTIVLGNCGDIHRLQGLFAESEQEQLEVLKIREKRFKHDLDESYYCLGKLYRDQKNLDKSNFYFEKALDLRDNRVGKHPLTALILEDYAKLKRAMHIDSEAEEMEQQAKVIREQSAVA